MTMPPVDDGMEWRLILHGAMDGPANMAVDEALLSALDAQGGRPVLRLYRWRRPTLSLGRFQSHHVVDERALQERGWDVVRRPTGGRAVLHDDELTYAIIAPRALAPKNGCSVTGTYRWLATGWCEALRRLGVEAEVIGRRRRSHRRGGRASCYAAASTSDLCVNGRKLIGSAQARRRRAVLQHGSAPLRLRVADWNAVLVRAGDMEAATDLRTAAGREVTVSELQAAVIAGFRAALGVQFESDRLTPEEMLTARELEESRYRSEEWLHHRDRVRGGAAKESVREMPAGIDARSVI